ncbi:MAG: carbonic anhydrase [Planctomycetes bacterium]|nr:carbonic anhydrase [Planctomycetota bacterium]
MDDIIAGVRSFQRDIYPQNRELFERLAAGQSPDALIITCSDSRVDPFMLTQARPGQLFVLRNAGNLVPQYGGPVGGVTATIEFAVMALGVPNIIICGHSGCGAMAGLLNPDQLRDMPRVTEWLKHAAVVRESMDSAGRLDAPDALQRAVEANVIVQLDHLRTHPSVAEKLVAGQIELHGWVYGIATGEVASYDAERREFVPL